MGNDDGEGGRKRMTEKMTSTKFGFQFPKNKREIISNINSFCQNSVRFVIAVVIAVIIVVIVVIVVVFVLYLKS